MLASKVKTEIIENHSEFSDGCANQGRSQDFSKGGGLKLWKQKLWKGKIACDMNSQESTYIVDKQLIVLTTKPGVPPTKLPSCFSDILSW